MQVKVVPMMTCAFCLAPAVGGTDFCFDHTPGNKWARTSYLRDHKKWEPVDPEDPRCGFRAKKLPRG